jgi:hypothetical protein
MNISALKAIAKTALKVALREKACSTALNSTADLYPEVLLWKESYGPKYADECFGPINSCFKEYNPKYVCF